MVLKTYKNQFAFTCIWHCGWCSAQWRHLKILHTHMLATCSVRSFLVTFSPQFSLVQETIFQGQEAKWFWYSNQETDHTNASSLSKYSSKSSPEALNCTCTAPCFQLFLGVWNQWWIEALALVFDIFWKLKIEKCMLCPRSRKNYSFSSSFLHSWFL